MRFRAIPPVISPDEPLGEFSGDLSGYLSGLILRLIPPGKTLSLSRQTGQKNG